MLSSGVFLRCNFWFYIAFIDNVVRSVVLMFFFMHVCWVIFNKVWVWIWVSTFTTARHEIEHAVQSEELVGRIDWFQNVVLDAPTPISYLGPLWLKLFPQSIAISLRHWHCRCDMQHHCGSDGSVMVFRDDRRRFNYLTTRDLNLSVDVKPVLDETFDFGPLGRYRMTL